MATKAYRGKYPDRIKIVSGIDRGAVKVTTYGGETLIVKAADTKGIHPKLNEDISKYRKNPVAKKAPKKRARNPIVKAARSKKPANFPHCVQVKATENWDTRACYKHKPEAVNHAQMIADQYPRLQVRVITYEGGEIPK